MNIKRYVLITSVFLLLVGIIVESKKKGLKKKFKKKKKSPFDVEEIESDTITFDEWDHDAAELFPLGDPQRELPDTMPEMRRWCRFRNKRVSVMKRWIEKKIDENLKDASDLVSSLTKTYTQDVQIKFLDYCETEKTMQDYVDNATLVNFETPLLYIIRKDFANLLIKANKKIGDEQIVQFCCGFFEYNRRIIETVDFRVKYWLQVFLNAYFMRVVYVFCEQFQKDSSKCANNQVTYPTDSQKKPSVKSLYDPIFNVTFFDLKVPEDLKGIKERLKKKKSFFSADEDDANSPDIDVLSLDTGSKSSALSSDSLSGYGLSGITKLGGLASSLKGGTGGIPLIGRLTG